MSAELTEQVAAALVQFSSTTRLYELSIGGGRNGGPGGLMVEAFAADEGLQDIGVREVIVLSTTAHIELESLLGQSAALEVSLADGTRTSFAGEICAVAMLGGDGGFARYRVRIQPWLWRLGLARNSRVWQDKTVVQIVDLVFRPYQPLAKWRWSEETAQFMDGVPPRAYCCQYRESDLHFVQRLLAEEGLAWRFEPGADGPVLVLFSDSTQTCAVPEDQSCAADGAIRYHGARAVERQDTVQALVSQRRLHATLATVLSYDYKAKRIVAASSPSYTRFGSNVPALETCDVLGHEAFANSAQARRYADLHMEAKEARGQLWCGRSTVRTLRAGTRLSVDGIPLQRAGAQAAFTVVRVVSVGVNNLPPPAQQALAELFGPIPELLQETMGGRQPDDWELALAQASESGYANCFEAIPADLPWRPELPGTDARRCAKPTAFGAQSAIVVGPDGSDQPNGPDEIYCDRMGRVRIRFHWQDGGEASCWVRVAQRLAGGGMGSQFLPRIGQEVAVQFLENDIDRPIIVGALYNGRGEGGIAPTPGGRASTEHPVSCFGTAHDHMPAGQGNGAGGNSPVWHGASADAAGHRNGAAQWGVRSKEFGGRGYNQLLFDDTDEQGRVQLKSTHAASELNLGHLIHSADNYRGSFRGLGAELRTDAYGAVRAGAGLLVSSYKINHGVTERDPAADNPAGISMLSQASRLAETFHSAAGMHQTVGLASHAGATKANASKLDDQAAPLKALVGAAEDKDAESGKAIISIAAKDGLGTDAGQSMQLANGETILLAAGQDAQFVTGGRMRIHAGQAIGVLAGAVKAGEGRTGLQLITAKDAIDIQAQADELKVQARDEIRMISANAHIDWAAAKRISLSTAGGANIVIEGGNITVQCPGRLTINAGKKSFSGPAKFAYSMPALPRSICVACLKKSLASGPAFTMVE